VTPQKRSRSPSQAGTPRVETPMESQPWNALEAAEPMSL